MRSPAGRRPLALKGQRGHEADGGVTLQGRLQGASGLHGLCHVPEPSRGGARVCLQEALEACRGLGGAEDSERKGPPGRAVLPGAGAGAGVPWQG